MQNQQELKDNRDMKWSPELLAAATTIVLTLLAQTQLQHQLLPSSTGVGLAASITIVVAAVLSRWLYRLASMWQFVITLVVTISIVLGVGLIAHLHETSPGRSARDQALPWRSVLFPRERVGVRVSGGTTQYGTGWGVLNADGSISIHIDSSQSNLIAWVPSASTEAEYYTQVTARLDSGSTATACAMAFAYQNASSFYQLALRSDGLQLAYWDGRIPARAYEGPVPTSVQQSDWNTIAVLVKAGSVTAYVNDREIFSDYLGGSLSGAVTFGTLDIGSGYTDDAQCEFRDPIVKTTN